MKFKIHRAKNFDFYFTLHARNGEIIATSEMYDTFESCKKGITAVRKASLFARIVDES